MRQAIATDNQSTRNRLSNDNRLRCCRRRKLLARVGHHHKWSVPRRWRNNNHRLRCCRRHRLPHPLLEQSRLHQRCETLASGVADFSGGIRIGIGGPAIAGLKFRLLYTITTMWSKAEAVLHLPAKL